VLNLDLAPKSDRKTLVVNDQSEKNYRGKPLKRSPVRVDRVRKRMEELGLNNVEVARNGGLERTFVFDLLKGKKATIRKTYLEQLAIALKCDPAYLRGDQEELIKGGVLSVSREVPPPRKAEDSLELAGILESGAFRTSQPSGRVPVRSDLRHIGLRQFAFRVSGDEFLALGMPDKTIVTAVALSDYVERYGALKSGQIVAVESSFAGMPGRELTLRKVQVFTDRVELRPATNASEAKTLIVDADGAGSEGSWSWKIAGVVTRSVQVLD